MFEVLLGVLAFTVVSISIYFLYQRRATQGQKKGPSQPPYLGTLAQGLVHEIRNPLSTFSVNLQLLQEELEEGLNGKALNAKQRINTLQREVQRLEEVLSDFLRFAREERLELKEHNVNGLVDEVVDFIAPEARKNNILIERNYGSDLPPSRIDATLIKQALFNIIINAQQAMPKGGRLYIHTSLRSRDIQIEITDTGVGIPKSSFDKIFQVYYSTKKRGTGLGLPTVKRIVEGHGGTITVESEEGKGSSFVVRLPLRR